MSLLDTPQAKALLDEATLSADDVGRCEGRLTVFLERNRSRGLQRLRARPGLGNSDRLTRFVKIARQSGALCRLAEAAGLRSGPSEAGRVTRASCTSPRRKTPGGAERHH